MLQKCQRNIVIWLAIIVQLLVISVKGRKCSHDKYSIKPKINKQMATEIDNNEYHLRFLQSSISWTPIKIYVDYTYLNTQTSIDTITVSFFKKVIDNTIAIYSNILTIQKTSSRLIITECNIIPSKNISKDLVSGNNSYDLVIFPYFDVTAEPTTEAYASTCLLDPKSKRPIAGTMAFNPTNFFISRKNSLEYYTMLVLHELNHILSFSVNLFEYFVDSNFKIIPIEQTVKNSTVNDVSRSMIITPKVVSAARKHFGCSSLQGIELEDQGGMGTALSHWESRVMLGDFMIGQSYPENVISEITLSFFEDSGWYKVNYYTGGLFRYGKNKGCDFVTKKCIINQESKFPNDFCIVTDAPLCFASKLAKGVCELDRKSSIPSAYRYFSDSTLGGLLYADFCPVAKYDRDEENKMFFSSNCAYGLSDYPDLGEVVGDNSACFLSSFIPKNKTNYETFKGVNKAICHSYECNSSDQTYKVTILNNTINCPKEGGIITNNSFDGNFYCPDYASVCTKTLPCKDAIDCALKKSEYKYSTIDYTINTGSYAPLSTFSSGNTIQTNSTTSPTPSKSSNAGNHFDHLKYLIFAYCLLFFLLVLG